MNPAVSIKQLRDENLRTTQKAIQAAVTPDQLIIQLAISLETTQKISNLLTEKLRAWYHLYNPEFSHATPDHQTFVTEILSKNRKQLLQQINKKEEESMGGTLTQTDLDALHAFATIVHDLFTYAQATEQRLEKALKQHCPNMQAVAGTNFTAKLLMLTGSLKRLSAMPASTIQLLGAEKALFRHLKEGAKSPKYGVLYLHPLVQHTQQQKQGKAARALAEKLAIAAKIDYFKGTFIGDKLMQKLTQRFS